MNFQFQKLILWSRNGQKRELVFLPNKVNVITGEFGTGKSAILLIIDYCLFASHSRISESVINENVSWYGINFQINDKEFTICRASLNRGNVSDDYYFSAFGEIPEFPSSNNKEGIIKSLLEAEFGIDRNVRVPFGSKYLSLGSKISLRFFFLLTTISEDIITSSNVFFDKQNEDRYRDALPRIFDLAVGIDTIENILAKDKRAELEAEIKRIERLRNRSSSKKDDFYEQRSEIVKRARQYGLIRSETDDVNAVQNLRHYLYDQILPELIDDDTDEYSKLKSQEYQLNRILRNLRNLKSEYNSYKVALSEVEDSIRPINYIRKKYDSIIKTSIFDEIVDILDADFKSIKNDLKTRTPVDTNVLDLIHDYEKQLSELRRKLGSIPQDTSSFQSDKEKYIFMGEIKAKLELYGEPALPTTDFYLDEINELEENRGALKVTESIESRNMFIKLLEEIIQQYISFAGKVLQNYEKYHPVFDYSNKALLLRKPLTDFIENVGSSSNHMFMHLFLFCGLHEAIQIKKAPFVPSYLIIDQPSRPYWGDPNTPKLKLDHSDELNIRKAFELLNWTISRIVKAQKGQFQIIVFEHVPPSTWAGLDDVHLVEEFIDGNALIPESWLQSDIPRR